MKNSKNEINVDQYVFNFLMEAVADGLITHDKACEIIAAKLDEEKIMKLVCEENNLTEEDFHEK